MTAQIAAIADRRLDIGVDRVEGWLVFSADPSEATRGLAPWDALHRTAASPGPAKHVAGLESPSITLRADVPAEDGVDIVRRSREAREGITRLAEGQYDGAEAPSSNGSSDEADTALFGGSDTGAADTAEDVDLAALAAEGEWPFVQRPSGRLAIDLGVPDRFCQAIVDTGKSGGCRARVELAQLGEASEETRAAVAVLLLTLASVVRFVRAGAEPRHRVTVIFVEVDIESAVTAAEFHHACSALSVACRMAGREVKALMEPDVARAYLSARRWAVSCTP